MIWGILAAMDSETELLCKKMSLERHVDRCGTSFHIGTLCNHNIVLACCGLGKVNAALCASALINEFHADKIIHIGIAGSISRELNTLDVVISSELLYHDIEPGVLTEYFPFREIFPADESLIKLAESACSRVLPKERKALTGRIVTGDQFIGSTAQRDSLDDRFHPLCVEMEGAAVAHTAYVYQKPFIIIRSISDAADAPPNDNYYRFKPLASDQSANIICEMLRLCDY